jgi:hypothetical protein
MKNCYHLNLQTKRTLKPINNIADQKTNQKIEGISDDSSASNAGGDNLRIGYSTSSSLQINYLFLIPFWLQLLC